VILLSLALADTVGNGAGLQCEEPHGHKNVRRGLKPGTRISMQHAKCIGLYLFV
jgi:hypothetical protein